MFQLVIFILNLEWIVRYGAQNINEATQIHY